MKILGKPDDDSYLCIITRSELKKIADKNFTRFPELEIGDDYDVALGYDFRHDMKKICKWMTEINKKFDNTHPLLKQFCEKMMETELPKNEDKR